MSNEVKKSALEGVTWRDIEFLCERGGDLAVMGSIAKELRDLADRLELS